MNESEYFDKSIERSPRAHAIAMLRALRDPDIDVDITNPESFQNLIKVKPELYAASAFFIEQSFSLVEEWFEDNEGMVPGYFEGDELHWEMQEPPAAISTEEFKDVLKDTSKGTPEHIFTQYVINGFYALMSYSFYKTVPDILSFKDGDDESSSISEESLTQELLALLFIFYNGTEYKYRENFERGFPEPHTFLLEGVATGAQVMAGMAILAPMLSQRYYGDTSPEHVAMCRAGMFDIVSHLTSVHIDTFVSTRQYQDGLLNPESAEGLLPIIQVTKSDENGFKAGIHPDFLADVEEYSGESDSVVRKVTVICPAMLAKSSTGSVVNKYLWERMSDLASETFDQVIDVKAFSHRMVDTIEEKIDARKE